MADRLIAMKVLVCAVRLDGLSAAARDMRMSPAMAAKHLDALKARLGATLVRTLPGPVADRRKWTFTTGRAVLLEVGEHKAVTATRSVNCEETLTITAPATSCVLHIAPLVPALHALHPGVTIEFGFSDHYVDPLEERWDVAIRIGRLPDSSLIASSLRCE